MTSDVTPLCETASKGKALSNNSKGNVAAPGGSQQQFDYFRERQQQLDIGHIRKQMDKQELDRKLGKNPC
jgi:hypothetical protein